MSWPEQKRYTLWIAASGKTYEGDTRQECIDQYLIDRERDKKFSFRGVSMDVDATDAQRAIRRRAVL